MLDRGIVNSQLSLLKTAFIVLLAVTFWTSQSQGDAKPMHTQIWDTVTPFDSKVDVRARAAWKPVPGDLLSLELQPSTAVSDPAYYGREYAFEGDAVVENAHFTVAFCSKKGKAVVYSKADSDGKKFELAPLGLKTASATIAACRILQNTGNEAALEVSFSDGTRAGNVSAVFSFDNTRIIGVRSAESFKGVSIFSPMEYGIVPDFVGDDLVYFPEQYPARNVLSIPSENLFMGLLDGQDSVLAVTWPKGKQQTRLVLGSARPDGRLIERVDLHSDGQNIYLALLEAPGIWHKEELKPTYLERDIASGWKRPFPAKWTTQLYEAGIRTTFSFRESKDKIWRGVTGNYTYPVWFSGQDAFYRLSKKIPPKGDSIVYFVEGKNTPASVSTPVDIMKATLGRQACEAILDLPGRKLRTHHRRGSVGIRRACTCGGTEAIQTVFEAGQEVERKEYVAEAVDDMIYFVTHHVARIDEYRAFADDMIEFLDVTGNSAADLKSFLNDMRAIVQEIPQQYTRHRENMKTLAYAGELARKTKALTQRKATGNLPAYLELSKQWRAMGGAQDNVIARYHSVTRKLSQEAGYRCVSQPEAVEIAQEIRRRCRQCLRNADGYEIWPDY
jgi:hypothetical protein